MQQRNKNKSRLTWLILKIGIAALAFWFIYHRIIEKDNTNEWWSETRIAISSHPVLFLFVFLLMFLNWSLEAIKWKWMIRKIEAISFLKSFEAVFSGLTISFFTPNRIGEYAGRIFHLETADRVEATLITIIENYSQLLVTIIFGSVSGVLYIHNMITVPMYLDIGLSVTLITLAVISVIVFFNVQVFEVLLKRFPFPASWNHYLAVFSLYSFRDLSCLLFLAMLRYLVFSFQFYLLLMIFGLTMPYGTALLLISLTFFLMTIIPTVAFSEIGVRGAVATYFFTHVSPDSIPVINSSSSIWFINLVFPALAGALFVFQFKFNRKQNQE